MQKYLDLGIDPAQARIAASKDMKSDVFKNLLSLGGLALANITFSGIPYATKAWAAYRNNNEEEFEDALKGLAIDAGYRAILKSIPDLPIMGTIIETLKTSIIEGKNWGTALETAFGKDLVGIPASAIADIWRFSTNLFSDEDRERLDALSTLIQVPLLVIFGVDPKTINNYIKAAGAAIDGEFDKMTAYALQLSPSQLKLFEDVNNSSMAKQNFKAKFGMTREEFEKRKANRGISEQRKQEIRKRMNDMRKRN
jgi:hypothetical protein